MELVDLNIYFRKNFTFILKKEMPPSRPSMRSWSRVPNTEVPSATPLHTHTDFR